MEMEKTPKIQLAVISTLLGLCIALITLVPEESMTQSTKFLFAFTATTVALAILYLKEIYEKRREYVKIKDEIGYMPRSIKYEKYRRMHHINPKTGDVALTFDLKVTNIGSDIINQVSIPISFQLTRMGKRGGRSPLNIEHVLVNNHELDNPQECYKRECTKKLETGDFGEEGHFQIPLESIEGIKKGDKCNILIRAICFGAFKNIQDHDWIATNIHHQMEVLEVVVSLEGKWIIHLFTNQEIPDGINIYDTILKVARPTETFQVPKPVIRRNTLSWVLKKPKLSYFYKLWFRATRAGKRRRK